MERVISGISFTTSTKGRTIIVASGYRFRKKRVYGAKTHWVCSTHHDKRCHAVIHALEDMTIVKCYNAHNH